MKEMSSPERKSRSPAGEDEYSRRRVAEDLDVNLVVEAAAGTGKTTSMVHRMTSLLREGRCRIENLAAVTFTRKAAAELRTRFRQEMERLSPEGEGEGDPAGSHVPPSSAGPRTRCRPGDL